jgi:hypothetical protein
MYNIFSSDQNHTTCELSHSTVDTSQGVLEIKYKPFLTTHVITICHSSVDVTKSHLVYADLANLDIIGVL